jgi:methylenetetrahydrofolate dehydrogenase (NADP+)/methenyltetrahydrofolate cyclohydrolase
MGILINGKQIAKDINQQTADAVKALKRRGFIPKLAVIFVGNHKPSATYIRKKQEMAEYVGMEFIIHNFPASVAKTELIKKIKELQKNKKISGVIVQLPLPERLYTPDVLNAINPELDVDCLTDTNSGKLVMGTSWLTPPTPTAVMEVLKNIKIDLKGKNVTIVGTGALVGRPLAIMMMNAGASVITCNSRTNNTKEKCLEADIVVTAVGKKDLLRGDMIQPDTVVIDTGIAFANRKMYGDANRSEILEKCSYLTPTPGGIGPITVALLLRNTLICAKRRKKQISI